MSCTKEFILQDNFVVIITNNALFVLKLIPYVIIIQSLLFSNFYLKDSWNFVLTYKIKNSNKFRISLSQFVRHGDIL